VHQRVELERFGNEVRRPLFDRLDGVLDGAKAGDHDGDQVGIAVDRRIEHLPAVDTRQTKIGNQYIERERGQPLERLFTAGSLLNDKSVIAKSLGDRLAERGLVIDDQQMFRSFSHLLARAVF
jgi:hypothetical protein